MRRRSQGRAIGKGGGLPKPSDRKVSRVSAGRHSTPQTEVDIPGDFESSFPLVGPHGKARTLKGPSAAKTLQSCGVGV